MTNKRYLSVCRPAKACPVRVEILEDRYLPAGFASSTLLPPPDSVTPVNELARAATGPVLDLVRQGTRPMLAPVSQGTESAFELSATPVGGRNFPEDGADLSLDSGIAAWDGAEARDTGVQDTSPGRLAGGQRLLTVPESGTQQENALANVGAGSQALLLGLPGLSGVASTPMRQGSVFAGRETFSAELETSIESRGETEKTRSGSGAGHDGVAPAAGRASAQEVRAEELAGTAEQERLLPPTAPPSFNELLGPAFGVIDGFLPFGPAAWKQATEQFFADLAGLVEEGGSLAPWLTVLALLGSAYELARRDLRRLQAQQVLDPTQLPVLSGLMPPGES